MFKYSRTSLSNQGKCQYLWKNILAAGCNNNALSQCIWITRRFLEKLMRSQFFQCQGLLLLPHLDQKVERINEMDGWFNGTGPLACLSPFSVMLWIRSN